MMTFLSPLLVWGALLGVIPLIIHLLNRRKFRRVEWAPMRYLKLTVQRNRRRVQVEQLLLMLLRIAAIALLFFYLAGRWSTRRAWKAGWATAAVEPDRLD